MSCERYEQVGWLHNEGRMFVSGIKALPEGQAQPEGWQPVYVKVPDPDPEPRVTYQEWLATQERCPTCGSDDPLRYVEGRGCGPLYPAGSGLAGGFDPWHAVVDKGEPR